MWRQNPGAKMTVDQAEAGASSFNLAGYSDWRLSNVREIQSVEEYTRSPSATNPAKIGPSINPLFNCTEITNETGVSDFPYYWTSTSANFSPDNTADYCAW